MKSHPSPDEIGELLRAHKPNPKPSAELENRILHALQHRPQSARATPGPWTFISSAAAAAAVIVFLTTQDRESAAPQSIAAPMPESITPAESIASPPSFEIDLPNPLQVETAALSRDARRASRFLIHSLPALSPESY